MLQLLRKLRGNGGEDDLGEICTLPECDGGGRERHVGLRRLNILFS